jgi:hypothetical protein
MSDRIHVATRKGLFALDRQGDGPEGWEIVDSAFIGDPVTMVLDDRRDGTLYAALNLGHFGVKLHRSGDGGKTWEECAVPSYEGVEAGEDKGPSLSLLWALEPGGADEAGKLWCGTIPGGLFVSTDRGSSWQLNRPLWDRPERAKWFGGGYDDPGLHSIVVDPRDARKITVGVSCGGVWVTEDGGESWECRTAGMWAAYMPPDKKHQPEIQDPHRIAACASSPDVLWVQHHNGVFRSTDAARSWTEITAIEPSSFGFAVAVHPSEPTSAWFAPGVKDECRVPVDGNVVVARTRDGGGTFELLRNGLPQGHAYDIVYRHALDIDASGDRLVMGSTTGSLWITEDGGDSWHTVSANLPPIYATRFA